MVDVEAAIGYVVAHGDEVDRARLGWLCSRTLPTEDLLDKVESGQAVRGGWPALWDSRVASIYATCFRLAELDDLGALGRPAARQALTWLAGRQRQDGTWEEDASLAAVAPSWARPGDAEARLYLTAAAGFWLAVSGPPPGGSTGWGVQAPVNEFADMVELGVTAFKGMLNPDGSWPSYLAAGWLGGAMLYYLGHFYESAQIQVVLAERVPELSPADTASLVAVMRRVGMSGEDWLLASARQRLDETQRTDGGWDSDDGVAFNVHTTLAAIRAVI
jgi:hypothetical protein